MSVHEGWVQRKARRAGEEWVREWAVLSERALEIFAARPDAAPTTATGSSTSTTSQVAAAGAPKPIMSVARAEISAIVLVKRGKELGQKSSVPSVPGTEFNLEPLGEPAILLRASTPEEAERWVCEMQNLIVETTVAQTLSQPEPDRDRRDAVSGVAIAHGQTTAQRLRAAARKASWCKFGASRPWHAQTGHRDTFGLATGGALLATFMPDCEWICVYDMRTGDAVLHSLRNHGQRTAIFVDGEFAVGGRHEDHDGNPLHEAPDGRGGALGFGSGTISLDVFRTTDKRTTVVMGSVKGGIAMCELKHGGLSIRWSHIKPPHEKTASTFK